MFTRNRSKIYMDDKPTSLDIRGDGGGILKVVLLVCLTQLFVTYMAQTSALALPRCIATEFSQGNGPLLLLRLSPCQITNANPIGVDYAPSHLVMTPETILDFYQGQFLEKPI